MPIIKFGVYDGSIMVGMRDTPQEALTYANRLVKDGTHFRVWVARMETLKKITSLASPPPEPLIEDD